MATKFGAEILRELEARTAFLSASDLSRIFHIKTRQLETRILKQPGFPEASRLMRKRLWRPDQVLEWVKQVNATGQLIGVPFIAKDCGVTRAIVDRWIAEGLFLKPSRTENGRSLYSEREYEDWKGEHLAGFRLPTTRSNEARA